MNLPDDAFIRATFPELNSDDTFSIVWSGQFNAPRDGEYSFATDNIDNRGTIWLDKNQNGLFERTEGSLGDERLTWGNQTATLFLNKGSYNTIIGFSEDRGAARFRARIQTSKAPAFRSDPHSPG